MGMRTMILLFCILQLVVSMDSNTITTEDPEPQPTGTFENETPLELVANTNNARTNYVQIVPFCLKYALLHPFSYFVTLLIDFIFICQYQPELAVYGTLQGFNHWLRFAYPNGLCGFVKKLNEFAAFCNLPIPYYPEGFANMTPVTKNQQNPATIQSNGDPMAQPLVDNNSQNQNQNQMNADEENKTQQQANQQQQNILNPNKKALVPKNDKCWCYNNVGILFGNIWMHKFSMLFTMFLVLCFIYSDTPVLGAWMTIQLLVSIWRTKCPNMSCTKTLNRWARDAGVPEEYSGNNRPGQRNGQPTNQQFGTQSPFIPVTIDGNTFYFNPDQLKKIMQGDEKM